MPGAEQARMITKPCFPKVVDADLRAASSHGRRLAGADHARRSRPTLILTVAALLLPCFSRGGQATPPAPPFLIAVGDPLARENACACVAGHAQRDYRVLADLVARELRRPAELVFCASVKDAVAQGGRRPDCFIGKTSAVGAPAQGTNAPVRCLAMLTGLNGETTLQGVFIVRAKDPARAVPDLAGRRILFGHPNDTEKYGAALTLLQAFGMAAPAPAPLMADTCTAAALAVSKGEADAAVISDYAWPLLSACGAVDSATLRIVGHTAPVPFIGVFATAPLSPADEAALRRALEKVTRSRRLRAKLETRDGFVAPLAPAPVSPEIVLPETFPISPRIPWRHTMGAQSLGGLFASGHKVIVSDKTELLDADAWHCLDADTGITIWTVTTPAAGTMDYTSAPRATPVIAGDQVYLLGAFGDLACVALETGRIHWRVNLIRRYGGTVPQWGFSGTPLLLGDRVIVQTASRKAGLVALNRLTGREVWRSPGSLPSYGSLIAAHLGGRPQIVGHDSDSLGGWDPETGRRLWRLVPPRHGDFNVPTPVQVGDMLLVATENNGTRLYAFNHDGTIRPEPWVATGALSPDISSPILVDGLVWGADSAGIHVLRVADNLKPVWESGDGEYTQYMSLTAAGAGHVLAASLSGRLHRFTSPPGGTVEHLTLFTPDGDFPPEAWSHPAVVGSRLFWRSARETLCLDLAAPH